MSPMRQPMAAITAPIIFIAKNPRIRWKPTTKFLATRTNSHATPNFVAQLSSHWKQSATVEGGLRKRISILMPVCLNGWLSKVPSNLLDNNHPRETYCLNGIGKLVGNDATAGLCSPSLNGWMIDAWPLYSIVHDWPRRSIRRRPFSRAVLSQHTFGPK